MDDVRTSVGSLVDDRYLLQSSLGAGGCAEVWRAVDQKHGRPVALKLLLPRHRSDPRATERFVREAETLLALDHPHIARAFAFEIDRAQPYVAMELVDGVTLDVELGRRSAKDDRFTHDQLLQLLAQLASALDHAHRRGVVHRDLKPTNVMLTSSGVKVLDFGIAKLLARDGDATTQGRVLGTFTYMSPEQARGEAVDARSDVFSLGILTFEALTLRRAFARGKDGEWLRAYGEPVRMHEGNAPPAMVARMSSEPRPRASVLVSNISARADGVLARAMAIEPRERFASAGDFAGALEKALRPRRSGWSSRIAASVVGVGLAGGLAIASLLMDGDVPAPAALEERPAPQERVQADFGSRSGEAGPPVDASRLRPMVEARVEARTIATDEKRAEDDERPNIAPETRADATVRPQRAKTEPSPKPKREDPRASDELKQALATLPRDPIDTQRLRAIADRISRAADPISDPVVRARVKRLASSSAMLGDFAGVERALADLERATP